MISLENLSNKIIKMPLIFHKYFVKFQILDGP
jgi:hypothetical protein